MNTGYSNNSDRMQILRMLEEGKINAAQAAAMLSGNIPMSDPASISTPTPESIPLPSEPEVAPEPSPTAERTNNGPRYFRVKVTDLFTGRSKATVTLPLGLVDWGLRVGSHFSPEMSGMDWEDLSRILRSGESGKLVDVMDDDDGEHVEIFID
jgi:hypothetical protein